MTRSIDAGSPWAKLPSERAPLMRAQVPGVTAQILSRIQEEIPEYSRPLDGPFGHAITNGIEHALIQFVHRVADPRTPLDPCAEMYRRLGCGEFREGRSLDTLQAAYRLGARIAWRSMSEFGEQVQLSTATMRALGEAVFEHIDDLAALAVEGYLAAQAKASGSRERRRRRLLELILAEPPTPRQVISELAGAVDWPLPTRVHVVALDPSGVPEPWLETRSGAPGVASRLGIHPQTVRYRLHQWEDLFGSALNDPDTRFELEVALRADRLARGDKDI